MKERIHLGELENTELMRMFNSPGWQVFNRSFLWELHEQYVQAAKTANAAGDIHLTGQLLHVAQFIEGLENDFHSYLESNNTGANEEDEEH